MKANEYFKKHGYKNTVAHLEEMNNEGWNNVFYRELKRLVESYELVESWGGLEDAKLYDLSPCEKKPESAGYKLKQAIEDVESCQ